MLRLVESAIIRARYPGVRAIEALAATAPLFLLLFAATYVLMARLTEQLQRARAHKTDSLYFTVTVFATVGFGDITATSQAARLMVTAQMILDLIVLASGSACSSAPSSVATSDTQPSRRRSTPKETYAALERGHVPQRGSDVFQRADQRSYPWLCVC